MATRKEKWHYKPWHSLLLLDPKKQAVKERNFNRNGSLLQEELIALCDGKTLPIRVFSAKETIRMSTYKDIRHESSNFIVSQGVIDESRRIYIKIFHDKFHLTNVMEESIREIVIATQMGKHKNSLKLLGICLETEFPILIYEYPEKGCLNDIIHVQTLHWKIKLKIGYEIAYAISYLQNAFHTPVIHRNLSMKDVFLDDNYVAKISGFLLSVLLPKGEDHLTGKVVGTTGGYNCPPEYICSGRVTVKTDVYIFGVILLELLAIRNVRDTDIFRPITKLWDGKSIYKIIDQEFLNELRENDKQEVSELILGCLAEKENDRPDIVEVAVTLKKLVDSC